MMKNLIYILLILGVQTYSQQFVVTKKGLRDQSASENNYLVLNIDDKKASELYQISLKFTENDYLNPGTKLLDKTIDQTLRISTTIKKITEIKNAGTSIPLNGYYDTELRFKDGKIKFTITNLKIGNNAYEVVWKGNPFQDYVIWNQKDELIRPELKVFIEYYFSKEAKDLKTYLSNYKDKNDW